MSKLGILTCVAVLVVGLASVGLAEDDDVFLEGSTSVGGHYYDHKDAFSRVGEWVSFDNIEDVLPDYSIDLFGGTGSLMSQIKLLYKDQATNSFGLDLKTDSYITARVDYRAFVHNFDHDRMTNLQGREQIRDPDGSNPRPGGKQVYNTDHDPLGRYFIQFERFDSDLKIDLPFMKEGKIYGRYNDQRKHGWKQAMTIDHCAFCHVESNRREVDDQVKTWRSGIEGGVGLLTFNYEFIASDYVDRTQTPNHHYDRAMHPVHGDVGPHPSGNPEFPYGVEFSSRQAFSDVTLPYNRGTTSEKRAHHVGLKFDLPKQNTLRGAYTYTKRQNWWTGTEGKFDAWVASWIAKPNQKTRLKARFLAYETKVDDVFVDLPLYREGRGGGGQNFDWTRVSAANRQVWQTDLEGGYRYSKGGYLKLLWRHKEIDRDAMTQSQTSYVNDNGTNVEIPAAVYTNKTKIDKIKLTATKRVSRKGNVLAYVDYTNIARPYMNPTAMCEEGMNGVDHNLAGNGAVYYFQRQRYGNGTSLPNKSLKGSLRGSYQLSSRSSLSGFLTGASEKNDKLNSFEFDRSLLIVGGSLWAAPSDSWLLTLGYSFNQVKSNANLCPPIFDG